MMPEKEIFDEPVVKFQINKVQFPGNCPVCGESAKSRVSLTIRPGKKRYLRAMWDPKYVVGSKYQDKFSISPRTLVIPVCEKHEFSSSDFCRLRVMCIIVTGIAIAIGWFAVYRLANDIFLGKKSEIWVYWALVFLIVTIVLTLLAFKPSPIEVYFKVIGFDPTLNSILVDFKNREYREQFLQLNPTAAKLVKWIVRAG